VINTAQTPTSIFIGAGDFDCRELDPIEKIRARNGRGRDEFCAINTGA
jgi:hypothetical protein